MFNLTSGCSKIGERAEETVVSSARSISGDYLLFRFRSTIGVMRFNFSVRDGKRWSPHAIFTLVSLFFVLRLSFTFGSVFDFRTFPRGSLAGALWRRELCLDFPGGRHRASNPTRLGFFFFSGFVSFSPLARSPCGGGNSSYGTSGN